MLKKILRNSLTILLCQLLAYPPLLRAEQLSLPTGDLVAPEISQNNYIDKVEAGLDHDVTVTVTDNIGVKQVTLYYRVIGTKDYQGLAMNNVANSDEYKVTITSDEIIAPGVEYYVQAMDNAGNSVLHGYSFSPLSVKTDSNAAILVAEKNPEIEEESNTWLWVGLGAAAIAIAALAGGGGGGGGGGGDDTATLTINASNPDQ